MSNERINEFLSWRGRLDNPEEGAGQGLDDREATWERLMERFRKTQGRRRFSGFWIAAACLLLAVAPIFHFFRERHVPVIAIRPVVPKPVVRTAPVRQPDMRESPEAVTREVPAAVVPVTVFRRRGAATPVATLHREAPPVLAEVPTAPLAVGASPLDTTMTRPVITPLKSKQLKVVHINELEGNVPSVPAVTATGVRRHFDIFLQPSINRQALPSPPPAPEAVLFKVKLSSSN